MAVYYLEDTYISFGEAVEYLIEKYNLSEEDASFVVNDYILEASKEDADKAVEKGTELWNVKTGTNIANREQNNPKNTPLNKTSKWAREKAREYQNTHNLDPSKLDTLKDKTRKEAVRDSTRSIEGSVPKHGANPEYSRDADKKAVAAYEKSTSKNQWKDYDIDKSVKDMDATKARIVKDRMERGEDLPESIKKRLAKKDNTPAPGRSGPTMLKGHKATYKVFDNEEDFNKQMERLHDIRSTNDPAVHSIKMKEFLKDMGEENYNGTILWPQVSRIGKRKAILFAKETSDKKKRPDKQKEEDYLHTSDSGSIKQLFSSLNAGEGGAYPDKEGRIYASRGAATNRQGIPITKRALKRSGKTAYKLDLDKDSDIYEDNNVHNRTRASYITSKKPVKVYKVDSNEYDPKLEKDEPVDTGEKNTKRTPKKFFSRIKKFFSRRNKKIK